MGAAAGIIAELARLRARVLRVEQEAAKIRQYIDAIEEAANRIEENK